MASIGLFKLMITLVIYVLSGVRGYKFFNTKAGVSEKLLESLPKTRCVIILEASFELGPTKIQDYSVIWDISLKSLTTSKLAIGLQKHHLIEVLEETGFLTQRGSTAHEIKLCRKICYYAESCKSELYTEYKLNPASKFVYSPTETVQVTTFTGRTNKIVFRNLSRWKQEELLLDRYIQRLKKIARWQATTAEDHLRLYETESANIKIARCLDKWQVNVQYRDHSCTTVGLLLATRAQHLSFTGENACLSTVENTFMKVDAGPGWEVTTSRDHTIVELINYTKVMGVTILGLPYLLQSSKKGLPNVFIAGDKTIKNSLYRVATYSRLDDSLFNNYGVVYTVNKREKLTIACD